MPVPANAADELPLRKMVYHRVTSMGATTFQADVSDLVELDTLRPARLPACSSSVEDIVAALRTINTLDGLADRDFVWLATHCTERVGEDGALLFREGAPASNLTFIVKGEIHVRRRAGPVALFIGRAGQMTGKLPFSRMQHYGGDGYSVGPLWAIDIHESLFPAMLAAIPAIGQRCVSVLLDRVREVTRMEQQAEKLTALGKLAANLAHELNNPASAAQRSATSLIAELRSYGEQTFRLGALNLPADQIVSIRRWVTETRSSIGSSIPAEDAATVFSQSDREDRLQRWLEAHGVADPWALAPTLAEADVTVEQLQGLFAQSTPDAFPLGVNAFTSSLRAERMAKTVLNSTVRIFDLISAIKDYSYMDQAPIQEVDLAQSLETTLSMFASRLAGVAVTTEFDPALPPLRAYGSELNQVWTALIENGLDALDDRSRENKGNRPRTLRVTTRLSGNFALVEITDSGPGIPPELQSRIFEPFFTTKAPGHGLGLGLDTAQRIVSKHSGFITVQSAAGETCFQVRLPVHQAGAY